jgi:NAD(P)H-flavin reductase
LKKESVDFTCTKIEEEEEIVLIAGGELGPLKECITESLKNDPAHDIRLFFGANSRNQLDGIEELRNLSDLSEDFHMVTALNSSHPDWDGEVGLITDVVRDHLESGNVKECFLYGTDVMVNETQRTLKNIGVPEGKINRQHLERAY